jgi:hypothetical protein
MIKIFITTVCAFSILATAPALAHDGSQAATCEDALTGFSRLEPALLAINELGKSFPPNFLAEFGLDAALVTPAQKLKADADAALSDWNPADPASTQKLLRDIVTFERKGVKYAAALELWSKRFQTRDYEEIRANPMLLLPNRIYKVKTDRGESILVRFSHRVLEEFFWDETASNASEHAADAVGRGFQPDGSSSNGIAILRSAIGGRPVYKIQIIGSRYGSYRVYGLITNGVIGFVTHEVSGDHDSRFLKRATARAIKTYDALGW